MAKDDRIELDEALLHQQGDATSDKEKTVLQSLRESSGGHEDVSRSTLHYGDQQEPDQTYSSEDDSIGDEDADAPTDTSAKIDPVERASLSVTDDTSRGAEVSDLPASGDFGPAAGEIGTEARQQTGSAVGTDAMSPSGIDLEASTRTPLADHEGSISQPIGPGDEAAAVPDGAAVAYAGPQETSADLPVEGPGAPSDIAPTELWIDQSGIASGHPGTVIGQIDMNGTTAPNSYTYTVSDDRFEIVDMQLKLREGISLDDDELGALALEVTATGPGGATLTQSLALEVIDTPEISATTGFRASYFDVDQRLSKLDQIDWSSDPTHEEVVSDINYRNSRESFWEGGDTDTFGARITGHVDVNEGGSFEFFLGGDDGVILLVNGEEVIDNDGLHGYRTRTGEIELEPGTHHIEVRYFENYGHAGLKLEWDGPGTDGRELVTSPELDDAQTVNGMPVTFELDISGNDAGATSYRLEGVPEGTEVQAGDLSAIADEAGTVDLSGWDLSLLSVTTPVEFVGDVDAQLVTTTHGTSGAIASTAVDLGFTVAQADLPPPSVDMGTGFRASYFDVDQRLSKLDQIDWSSDPTHEEVVSDINYRNSRESFWEGGDTDTFGARITGNVDVEEGGSFKFFLGGDDGVVLLVNGEEVIDNDGLHGYRTRTGEIELEPGTHHIEVRYFENYGHAGLKLEWDGPGTDGRELVTGNSDLSVEENGMIAVKIDDTNLSDAAQVQISGLPPDTILISDDDVAVSDGGEIDLTGWDLDLLEIAPPPGFEGEISGEVTSTDIAFNGETVSGHSFFAIQVGDEVEPSSPAADGGPSDMMAYSEQAGSEGSWVDAAEAPDDKEQSNENAMEEPVIEQSDSTQYNDMNETYERSDW